MREPERLTFLTVQDELSKYYAGHKKLSDGIIEEAVNIFNRRNLFMVDFVVALNKYREAMSGSGKQSFTPDGWDLLRYTRKAKKDLARKFVMGVPSWDARSKEANSYYRRAELVLYAQYGIDNFCSMEGGWDRRQWDAFMERAIKHDIEKDKRKAKHREENEASSNEAKQFYTNVCNRLAGKELIPMPPPAKPANAGLVKNKPLCQQKRELI